MMKLNKDLIVILFILKVNVNGVFYGNGFRLLYVHFTYQKL
jgi:hypothetical protein